MSGAEALVDLLADFGLDDDPSSMAWDAIGNAAMAAALGRALGYPRCCVLAFVVRRRSPEAWDADALHHPKTGHILCGTCATNSMAELETPDWSVVEKICGRDFVKDCGRDRLRLRAERVCGAA